MGKHHKRRSVPTLFEAAIAIRTVRPDYHMVDFMREGVRVRKCFADIEEAKAFCRKRAGEIKREGTRILDLPEKVRGDALEAMKLLDGSGVSILTAVQDYLRRHPVNATQTVEETCQKYLEAMRHQGLRPLSVYDKELKFKAFTTALGKSPIAGLDDSDIEAWAATREGTKTTKEAYASCARDAVNFFRRGNKLKRARNGDEKPPVTWDVARVQKIMGTAETVSPEVVPAFAVLFFAGLRPHEMLRLTWEQVDLKAGVIRLTGADTKTRAMRNVEIASNLRAWLARYRGTGNVAPAGSRYRDLREKVMEACGLGEWPVDVPRHTFATMHYNAHQDAAKTQAQLGHFGGPQVFLTHYKGVPVTAADAAKYWKIRPAKVQGEQKVLRFAAAG